MVEQQTWVTLLGVAGFTLALAGYLHTVKRDLRTELKGDIAGLRTELKAEIADCRADLKADIADVKADIGRLDGQLTTIEQRPSPLSTRLPPAPARPGP
jgi:septal ring factor EnvC (AmiA/AmiB activator)